MSVEVTGPWAPYSFVEPRRPAAPATNAGADVSRARAHREVALVDLLDRLLANGVVLTGELTLAIADVDLVHISLRALVTSISEGQASWHRGGRP